MNPFKRFIRSTIEQVKDWNDPDREANPTSCPAITIEGVPQSLYDKLLSEATAAGAIFAGTKAYFDHCEFDWGYDAPSQTLSVTCTKKPFFIDCATIEQKIRELVSNVKDVVG